MHLIPLILTLTLVLAAALYFLADAIHKTGRRRP